MARAAVATELAPHPLYSSPSVQKYIHVHLHGFPRARSRSRSLPLLPAHVFAKTLPRKGKKSSFASVSASVEAFIVTQRHYTLMWHLVCASLSLSVGLSSSARDCSAHTCTLATISEPRMRGRLPTPHTRTFSSFPTLLITFPLSARASLPLCLVGRSVSCCRRHLCWNGQAQTTSSCCVPGVVAACLFLWGKERRKRRRRAQRVLPLL